MASEVEWTARTKGSNGNPGPLGITTSSGGISPADLTEDAVRSLEDRWDPAISGLTSPEDLDRLAVAYLVAGGPGDQLLMQVMSCDRETLARRMLEAGMTSGWIADSALRFLFELLLRRRDELGRLVHLPEVTEHLVGAGTDVNTAEMAAAHIGKCLSALYLCQIPPETVCERLHTRFCDKAAMEMQERYLKERSKEGVGPLGALQNLRTSMDQFISSTGSLPRITTMRTMIGNNTPHARPDVWDGILRHGDKLFLGAPSKAAKTFTLMSFAAATSAGVEFWGRRTRQTNVLYVNFELHADTFARRLETIRQAMGLPESAFDGFDHWGLRGHVTSLDTLAPEIISRARGRAGLIVLDPIYKALGDRDENSAGDITSLCNLIESICRRADASVAVALHFAKGNAGGKSAIDRISGSGVFARDPDAHLTMTPHEQDGAYVVSATLRDHPCPPDWCVQWEYPLMRLAPDLDPEKVKKNTKSSRAVTAQDVLEAMTDGRAYAMAEIIDAVRGQTGASNASIRSKVKAAEEHCLLQLAGKRGDGPGRKADLFKITERGQAALKNGRDDHVDSGE